MTQTMETTEQPVESVQTVAARWAVRLDAGPLAPEEQRALEQWLAVKPQHHGALIRARSAWTDLDRLAALAAPSSSPERGARGGTEFEGRGFRYWPVAASLAAAAVLGVLWFALNPNHEVYTSAIGEVRRITLNDGTSMVLNTASEARVQFTGAGRDVVLVRGEALFDVARDPAHPFVVRAGDFSVKALGTAFAVRIDTAQIDVTVTEGVVEVQSSSSLPPKGRNGQGEGGVSVPVRLTPNHRAILFPAKPAEIIPVTTPTAERRLAWRNGMVAFDGESLAEAVAEVNRHNRRRILVRDSALAARPVIGLFKATDPQGFARTAAAALGAQVAEDGDAIVILSTPD